MPELSIKATFQTSEESLFNKRNWHNQEPLGKIKTNTYPTSYMKVNFIWTKYLNSKKETMITLEEDWFYLQSQNGEDFPKNNTKL